VREREDLVATRVGKHRSLPTGERVEPAHLLDKSRTGPEVQMIGVPEHDPDPRRE
jgi:hypothetical protein